MRVLDAKAAAAGYLQTGSMGSEEARLSNAEWKQVLGTPATVRHVPRPDLDDLDDVDEGTDPTDPETLEYGGGPSFDGVYTTPLLDWVFESRNVGRHDGHMANLRVTRNGTGLPWVDGWSEGDEALDRLLSDAMNELDRNPPPPAGAATNAFSLDPFSE